jgi:hypothetical protein
MKNTIICTLVLVLCTGVVQAQERHQGLLAVGIGGGVNYYYGPSSRNFDQFEGDRLNGQLDAMIGFRLGRTNSGGRTLLAAFGTFGLNNRSTLNQIFADQGYVPVVTDQSSLNNFYRLEGGVLLGETVRLSTGVGQQHFNEQLIVSDAGVSVNSAYLQYYSSTAGFQFNVGGAALMVNVNFAYGRDFNRTVITPAAGLLFRF